MEHVGEALYVFSVGFVLGHHHVALWIFLVMFLYGISNYADEHPACWNKSVLSPTCRCHKITPREQCQLA